MYTIKAIYNTNYYFIEQNQLNYCNRLHITIYFVFILYKRCWSRIVLRNVIKKKSLKPIIGSKFLCACYLLRGSLFYQSWFAAFAQHRSSNGKYILLARVPFTSCIRNCHRRLGVSFWYWGIEVRILKPDIFLPAHFDFRD